MLKKITLILILLVSSLGFYANNTYSAGSPNVNCVGLPGCNISTNDGKIADENGTSEKSSLKWIGNIVGESIKYVSVFAVISLILSGFLYLFSGGEEEKTKKAKTWIIWSLTGVLISISAWGIINMVNSINIL